VNLTINGTHYSEQLSTANTRKASGTCYCDKKSEKMFFAHTVFSMAFSIMRKHSL